jgi:serine/threonine protein kinase
VGELAADGARVGLKQGRDGRMAITTLEGRSPPGSDRSLAAADTAAAPVAADFSKYRLIARLGSGGMAEVFLALSGARRKGLSKLVVLKVLRPDLAPDERADFARMFYDEGRLAMLLNHPNIVQAHEVGSEDAISFIAMEYLEGQPLSAIQDRAWKSAPSVAPATQPSLEMQLHLMCQVLDGLEYAHTLTDYAGQRLDIVHRDVSPQNVFVTYSGHTKLMDFGIAKTLESNSKTAAGVVKGKVRYMAPEQVRCGRVDHRADLFSVGVMLWEAIARRSMHGTASLYEVVGRLVNGDLPPIGTVVPDVDRHLEQVVTQALSLDPDRRYENAGVLREELLVFLDGRRKVSSRELGERVSRLFEPEREALSKVIWHAMNDVPSEEVMARVNAAQVLAELPWVTAHGVRAPGTGRITAAAQPPKPAAPGAPLDVSRAGSGPPSETRVVDGGSVAASTSPIVNGAGASGARPNGGPSSPGKKPRGALWLLAAGAGLVALLVAIGGPLKALTREGPVPAPSDAPVPIIVDLPTPTPRIRLNLQATPASARFFLDGQALEGNPYQGERSADSILHTLEVIAPGHEPRSIQIQHVRDLDLDVRLAAVLPVRTSETTVDTPPAAGDSKAPPPGVNRASDSRNGSPKQQPSQPRAATTATRGPSSGGAATRRSDEIYPDEPLPSPDSAALDGF